MHITLLRLVYRVLFFLKKLTSKAKERLNKEIIRERIGGNYESKKTT